MPIPHTKVTRANVSVTSYPNMTAVVQGNPINKLTRKSMLEIALELRQYDSEKFSPIMALNSDCLASMRIPSHSGTKKKSVCVSNAVCT